MQLFMTEISYDQDSLNAMSKRPSDRARAFSKTVEAHGGNLLHFYWVFGDRDVVAIYEMPDPKSAMAALISVAGLGAVKSQRTTALLSNDDAMAAMLQSGSIETGYTTPRAEWQGWQDEGGEGG